MYVLGQTKSLPCQWPIPHCFILASANACQLGRFPGCSPEVAEQAKLRVNCGKRAGQKMLGTRACSWMQKKHLEPFSKARGVLFSKPRLLESGVGSGTSIRRARGNTTHRLWTRKPSASLRRQRKFRWRKDADFFAEWNANRNGDNCFKDEARASAPGHNLCLLARGLLHGMSLL